MVGGSSPGSDGGADDLAVVAAIYAAMAARELERLYANIDESFVVTQDERLPWGGRFEGHDGLAQFAVALTGTIDSVVTTEAMFTADGDVVQFGRTRGTVRANGNTFDVAEVHRWTLRDGRAVRAHFSIDNDAMLAAIGPA
jgi:ketosteroid isomerase-like protein